MTTPRPKQSDPLVTLTRGEAARLARALDEALRALQYQRHRLLDSQEVRGVSSQIDTVHHWLNEEIALVHQWAQRLRDEMRPPPMPAHVDDVPQFDTYRAE